MRIWLIENYARRFKENGSGAVNFSNTMEKSKIALKAQRVAHILLNRIFCKGNIDINEIYIYMQIKHMPINLSTERATN